MGVIQYLAYGSNMLTERLQARCGSATARVVACADNWALSFSKRSQDGSGKATISAATGGRVFGVVFDLDETELPELDRLEGAGKGYDRKEHFPVHTTDSRESLNVVTYIASVDFTDPNLKPYDWYLKLIVAGARQHSLPPEYIAAIEATPSVSDPTADRPSRREALDLLERIPR